MPFHVLRPDDAVWPPLPPEAGRAATMRLAAGSAPATIYWLVALITAYIAIALLRHHQARRAGASSNPAALVLTGLGLLGLLLVPVFSNAVPGNVTVRGLWPLVVIAVGLGVWAWVDRSLGLVAVAVLALVTSVVAVLYDVVNLIPNASGALTMEFGLVINVVPFAVVLLGASLVFAIIDRGQS
jgi:hypothetical protein